MGLLWSSMSLTFFLILDCISVAAAVAFCASLAFIFGCCHQRRKINCIIYLFVAVCLIYRTRNSDIIIIRCVILTNSFVSYMIIINIVVILCFIYTVYYVHPIIFIGRYLTSEYSQYIYIYTKSACV